MQIFLKTLRGLLWALVCMIGAAIAGSLLSTGIAYLAGSPPASVNFLFAAIIWVFIIAGALGGFYLGYTGRYSRKNRDAREVGPGSAIFLVIGLLLLTGIGSCLYLNIKAYQKYGYYVLTKDESVFDQSLNPTDPDIQDRNRALKADIEAMDRRYDEGDGPNRGRFRWYGCMGIDCDEGWERRAYQ